MKALTVKKNYIFSKWCWLWLWLFPTKIANYVTSDGCCTCYYKYVFGTCYVIKMTYEGIGEISGTEWEIGK